MTGLLISALDLAALHDPKPVILDCRFALADPGAGRRQYLKGHIPGAVYIDLERDLSGPKGKHGGRHPLPELEGLQSVFRAAGISRDSRVVVYDDSRFAFASRAWWLLRYLGHADAGFLDGGFSAWINAGLPVETKAPQPKPGDFEATVQTDMVVDYPAVREISENGGALLIDCREQARYLGLEEPLDPVAGHIPGAINYPWQLVTDEQGLARPASEQTARWQELPNAEERVFYCGSGVTACVNQLSMELAGQDMGKLYVGSWSDWCSYLDLDGKSMKDKQTGIKKTVAVNEELLQSITMIARDYKARGVRFDSDRLQQPGMVLLFSGPSGTGKTMAAELLAKQLKIPLYRMDLACVLSKYIGETEKNLGKLFDKAEQSGAILFFDEADALFGKRSQVKDSHDRYANQEISYLLARLESQNGLAIFSTRQTDKFDSAFLRRIRTVIKFPLPGSAEEE